MPKVPFRAALVPPSGMSAETRRGDAVEDAEATPRDAAEAAMAEEATDSAAKPAAEAAEDDPAAASSAADEADEEAAEPTAEPAAAVPTSVSAAADSEVTRFKEEAGAAYRSFQYSAARELYTAALERLGEGGHRDLQLNQLRSALLVNRAMAQLQIRTELDSKRVKQRAELATLSVADCTAALELFPPGTKALYHRARARDMLGWRDESITDLQRLLKKTPNNQTARRLLEELSGDTPPSPATRAELRLRSARDSNSPGAGRARDEESALIGGLILAEQLSLPVARLTQRSVASPATALRTSAPTSTGDARSSPTPKRSHPASSPKRVQGQQRIGRHSGAGLPVAYDAVLCH
ncbi:hypothetical protein T492DRAFT_469467 [Pavlovales sp. CCMP2436]|nr:hypothetical protein T492DRAFT_469467 [Pavlovales sp. CCMP2436]